MKIVNRKEKATPSITAVGDWGELPVRINIVNWRSESEFSPDELHFHLKGTETYAVLEGSAIFEVNGREVNVDSRHALVIEPREKHRLREITDYPYLSVIVNTINDNSDRVKA
jgi:mannose-6-phosphate isomerase-like protein (cupin superfamily)